MINQCENDRLEKDDDMLSSPPDALKVVAWKSPSTSAVDPLDSVEAVRRPANPEIFARMRDQIGFENLSADEKKPKQVSRRSNVSFADKLGDREIPHMFFLDELTIDQQCWYSRDEIRKIRQECEETIEMVRNNEARLLPRNYCKRGLESWLLPNCLTFLENVHEIRNQILDLQIELWICRENDDIIATKLAEAYRLDTAQYVIKAQVRGVYDWKSAQTDAED